ncbi:MULTISPECIES: thiosulfate oxidation carrier protein SoxY [Rhizobium/Agrobacterium group]|uniref:thiosulfate oxidation carrier protein SoxY n=1 Tax=Rhizobium/Agrobacterium group TaxID=227290 RepID=UPI0006B9168B|nr:MULTISPECIES: thiosulfate oxidation carrier protein SoxY [Rhizobium/Agrobacterium group]AOG10717.1 thiosulfate oxidation carrier protein SoxY [Agrobacterium sp. RAC06]KPF61077.1 thiosulfate oxidation carrier protein SoxY [Rhizobium sp. AAP116]QGG92005.1 thiosulfate oxidation carrier protein SoxY [Agrobacterium sp. MA01]
MSFTRRDMLFIGLGGVVAATLPSLAAAATTEELVKAFTGGATPGTDGITLTAPEIAENGNTVPVSVDAPGAVSIMLLATGNPEPAVATFTFGPAAGNHMAATRIRLAKTQDVVALAKMADGSIRQAQATVKVTIGGCGG